MRIGITFDLREEYRKAGYGEEETAEFDNPETIDAIDGTLIDLGYETHRIGSIFKLINRLSKGERWDLVFNIAEGLRGYGREAQIPALLEAYDIPYTFSDALVLALSLHKGMAKRIVRDLGISTPDFLVVQDTDDISEVTLPFPLFAKPVAGGTSMGISNLSVVRSKENLEQVCTDLLNRFKQPVLIEKFLTGREFTVGILGTGKKATSPGVLEVFLKKDAEGVGYTYLNKERYEELIEYRVAKDGLALRAKEVALEAWKGLGCRDAGRVDVRTDSQGVPHFLEVNPLAGLHPIRSDLPILCRMTGIPYKDLIKTIMDQARSRYSL